MSMIVVVLFIVLLFFFFVDAKLRLTGKTPMTFMRTGGGLYDIHTPFCMIIIHFCREEG